MLRSESVWTLIGMLVVAVAVLVLAYLATRWIGAHGVPGGAAGLAPASPQGRLRVLAQLAVGRNERLLLVRLGDKCLLLGAGDHGVTLLRELSDDEAREWLAAADEPKAPTFMDALSETLRKRK